MNVAGIDLSTRAVDIVRVPLDGDAAPQWDRFELDGADAFDRARDVAQSMPRAYSAFWDDTIAVGIEHPAGKHGVGPLLRIQGAILGCIPPRMLVEHLPPGKWRKLVGLAGNASKDAVADFVFGTYYPLTGRPFARRVDTPQDACDAYCIALAMRQLLDKQAA